MKWYQSLTAKNIFLFIAIGFMFIFFIVLNIEYIKENRLEEKVQDEIVKRTHSMVSSLLIKQRLDEMLVRNMAQISTIDGFNKPLETLLKANINKDIVSAGVWFKAGFKTKDVYFYTKTDQGDFFEIKDYSKKSKLPFRKMEFYVLGKHLKKGETFWTKLYIDSVTKEKMVTVVSGIFKDDVFVGVASVDVKLSKSANEIFHKLIHSNDSYFVVTDRVGNIIIYSKNINQISDFDNINHMKTKLFTQLFYKNINTDIDKKLALSISVETPEIDLLEAKSISYEIKHKSIYHNEDLIQKAKEVENDPYFNTSSVLSLVYFPHTGWNMYLGIPKDIVFKDTLDTYNKIILIIVLFSLLATLVGFLFIRHFIVLPLNNITKQIENSKNNLETLLYTNDHAEIAKLVDNFNKRTSALVKAYEAEARSEKLLLQQSKMAAIGEMLDAVAHQWKQPLNAISMYSELIKSDFEDALVDQAYIDQFQNDIQIQIEHMSDTLSTFRSFFRPNTKQEYFCIKQVVEEVLFLAKDELTKNTIEVDVDVGSMEIYGSINEFKHLVLNIINNAKDAFIDNNISKRKISISTDYDSKKLSLNICDNAGGIPQELIKDIFKAHFTTKEEGKGTGIGLYMSSQIAQKHHAKLGVKNIDSGACFYILFDQHLQS